MKKAWHTVEQIIAVLQEAQRGANIEDLSPLLWRPSGKTSFPPAPVNHGVARTDTDDPIR